MSETFDSLVTGNITPLWCLLFRFKYSAALLLRNGYNLPDCLRQKGVIPFPLYEKVNIHARMT